MELNVYSTFNKINLWCNSSDLAGILSGINLASYEQLSVRTYVCMYVCVCASVCLLKCCTGLAAGTRMNSPRGPKTL